GGRGIIGLPGYGRPLRLDLAKPQRKPETGVQLLAKVEQLHLVYRGAERAGALDAKTPNGQIVANALSFGVNTWVTRHLRLAANYGFYSFPHSEPVSASTTGEPTRTERQRALAPAQLLTRGVDDTARNSSHALHEVSA